jgi:hypothetical protein
MARNTGNNSRKGAVSKRTQVFNPSTGHYVKRDAETGRFMDVKSDGKPFKGVTKEKSTVKSNPSIKKSTADKAERAVISVRNKSRSSKKK